MKGMISLTHRCNLSCRYCYSGKSLKEDITPATMVRAVDFILDVAGEDRTIEMGFFGGEPLLRFDLIQEGTEYIRMREAQTGKRISIGITTNGTIMTPAMLACFKKQRVSLCISIDGPASVHDLNRVYGDGRGSHAVVEEGLDLAMAELKGIEVNAVYGPDTLGNLPETVSWFIGKGVGSIHLNPSISADWSGVTHEAFLEAYAEVAQRYIESYETGTEVAVDFLDNKIVLFINGGYAAQDICRMGEKEWGIAPSGNIYPCERFIGEDTDLSFCLGNLETGLLYRKRCGLLERRGNRNPQCRTCDLSKYCMNWCGCTNHFTSGRTDLVAPAICASERAAILVARQAFVTLTERGNQLFLDHLENYVEEGHHYHIRAERRAYAR